jgi:hypothetical protein
LNVVIQIASKIEDNALLERVIEKNPKPVSQVLDGKRSQGHESQRKNQFRIFSAHAVIDDPLRYPGKDHNRHRRENGKPKVPSR